MDKMTKNQFLISVLLVALAALIAFPSAMAAGKQACNDRLDNDGDGYSDLNDPGCKNSRDTSELNPYIECDDNVDNDGDGFADYMDAGCSGPADGDESNCGDYVCEGAETQSSCPADCGYADSCSDTDGGNNVDISGTIYGYSGGIVYNSTDYCLGSSSVVEHYCSGTAGANQQQACPYGCSDGKCNAAPVDSCSDTDSGFNPYITGTAYGYFSNGYPYNYTDQCMGSYALLEYYCSGTQLQTGNYSCSGGNTTVCLSGACR